MGPYEKNHNLVILVPQLVIHATAGMMSWGHGNPVKHAGDSRLLISLLDSRYDEKYGRWRSLFFYRSGMTTGRRHSRAPTRYSRDSGDDELGTRESSETCRR